MNVYVFPGDVLRIPTLAQKLQAKTKGIYDESRVISRALDALEKELQGATAKPPKAEKPVYVPGYPYFKQGQRLNEIRRFLKLTQIEFAAKLEMGQGAFSAFETGRRPLNRHSLIVLHGMGIDTNWYLTGKGEMIRKVVAQ